MSLIQSIKEKHFSTGYRKKGKYFYWIAIHNTNPKVVLVSKSRDWKEALEVCFFMVDKWHAENLFQYVAK